MSVLGIDVGSVLGIGCKPAIARRPEREDQGEGSLQGCDYMLKALPIFLSASIASTFPTKVTTYRNPPRTREGSIDR